MHNPYVGRTMQDVYEREVIHMQSILSSVAFAPAQPVRGCHLPPPACAPPSVAPFPASVEALDAPMANNGDVLSFLGLDIQRNGASAKGISDVQSASERSIEQLPDFKHDEGGAAFQDDELGEFDEGLFRALFPQEHDPALDVPFLALPPQAMAASGEAMGTPAAWHMPL